MIKTKIKKKIYQLPVFIEKDEDWFVAFCPSLQGCYAQGQTLEESLSNIKEVIQMHLKDRVAAKETIRHTQLVSLSALEVQI